MRVTAPAVAIALSTACGVSTATDDVDVPFLDSRAYRRAVLEEAVVNPDNGYSRVRLQNYAVPGGWDDLEEWRPMVAPVTTADFGTFDEAGFRNEVAVDADWALASTSHEDLIELGRRAFDRYPMATDARLAVPLRAREDADATGIWVDSAGRVGGLVAVQTDAATQQVAWTCATCHASVRDGEWVVGRSNPDIDVAAMYRLAGAPNAATESWGPGRIDPSRDRTNNPSVVPDLRAIRKQSHLHWTATLENSLPALAVRVDTLLIVSQEERRRPPREVAYALAYYLWNLEPPTRSRATEGAALFEQHCADCHHADGTVAEPLPLPWEDRYPERGTGLYRVPSLAGIADRARLLHDGSVPSVAHMLRDPPTSHPLLPSLSQDDQRALTTYVEAL